MPQMPQLRCFIIKLICQCVSPNLDLTQIKRSNSEEQTIALEFPSWMTEALNKESQRLNLPLQVIVKGWIEEKLASSNSVQITH
jgi:hypothetical protein